MRYAAFALVVTAAAGLAVAALTTANAKGAIEISPDSGLPGTVVRVHAMGGFQPGLDARIELVRSPEQPRVFYTLASERDLPDSLHLATVRPTDNYEIKADMTMPTAEEISEKFGSTEGDFDIIAIGRNDQIDGLFVSSAAFDLTVVTAPAAGGPADDGLPVWPLWASLGVASAACIVAGWRFRISQREVRHGDAAHGGRKGP